MKNEKESAIAFGITLASADQYNAGYPRKSVSGVHRENIQPGNAAKRPIHVIEIPRRKIPAADQQPFPKDMLKYKPVSQPKPLKPISLKEQDFYTNPEYHQFRTASYSYAGNSGSMESSVVWEVLKFIGKGIFLVLKYTVITVCLVITVACYCTAGRK